MKDYSKLDLLLHRLALGSIRMRRIAFDVDCILSNAKPTSKWPHAPVYVAGLARSGTTILLEILYASRAFATLTYRNMPLVTAPRLWSIIASRQYQKGERLERAHGDGVEISFDSPEAFEEPFWMMLTDEAFIRAKGLDVHNLGDDKLMDYRRYVGNILVASGMPTARYLAKNNNNILRISSLLRAFPDACILVPFRNPWEHANSLFRQHRRFSVLHAENPVALSYMNWLGHFEFGANLKPFMVGPDAQPSDAEESNRPDYWLRYWMHVYRYLLNIHGKDVVFFDYDRFCREPVRTLERLAKIIDLEPSRITCFARNVREPTVCRDEDLPEKLVSEAADLYVALQENSLQTT